MCAACHCCDFRVLKGLPFKTLAPGLRGRNIYLMRGMVSERDNGGRCEFLYAYKLSIGS